MSTSPVAKALAPETKLLHRQYAPMVNRPSRPTTLLHHSFACPARNRKEFHHGKRSSPRRTAELLRSFRNSFSARIYKHFVPTGLTSGPKSCAKQLLRGERQRCPERKA